MNNLRGFTAAFFAFGVVALSACGATGSTGATPAMTQPAGGTAGADWEFWNVGGQYSGSVKDSSFGTGTASANIAQYRGSAGGSLAFTFGTTVYSNAASALVLGAALRGTYVATISSAACSFAFTAKYDAKSYVLGGGYHAVKGCSGEKGTFSLTEQCYYARDWAVVRPDAPGLKSC
jgi:hypothetical protein